MNERGVFAGWAAIKLKMREEVETIPTSENKRRPTPSVELGRGFLLTKGEQLLYSGDATQQRGHLTVRYRVGAVDFIRTNLSCANRLGK